MSERADLFQGMVPVPDPVHQALDALREALRIMGPVHPHHQTSMRGKAQAKVAEAAALLEAATVPPPTGAEAEGAAALCAVCGVGPACPEEGYDTCARCEALQ